MTIQATCVGANFRPAGTKDIIRTLSIGDELLVEREPDNAYDSNAVKVLTKDGDWIGYVAKESNMELAEHLDNGGEARVTIISFLSNIKPHLEIELLAGEDGSEDDGALDHEPEDARDSESNWGDD